MCFYLYHFKVHVIYLTMKNAVKGTEKIWTSMKQKSKKYPQNIRVQPENPRQNVFPCLRAS